jgi:hypothetical protein
MRRRKYRGVNSGDREKGKRDVESQSQRRKGGRVRKDEQVRSEDADWWVV